MTNGRDDHERVVTHSDLSLITGEVGSVSRVQLTVCVYVCVCVCVCVCVLLLRCTHMCIILRMRWGQRRTLLAS